MTTVTYVDGDGDEQILTNVRHTSTKKPFLVVRHTDDAPDDMGWYDAQELHGYDEQKTEIPLQRVVRIDGEE